MSKISVTTIAGLTSGGDANKVKIESGDTLQVESNATVGGTLAVTGTTTTAAITSSGRHDVNFNGSGTQAFKYTDTGGGNLASFGQFYNPSNALIGNIQNANNDGIHLNIKNGSVCFSNVGYTAANALDDYEEGTFTPSFTLGVTNPVYQYQTGRYTKIGRMVYIETDIRLTGGTGNSSQVVLGGLPFTSNSAAPYSALYYQYNGSWNNITYPSLFLVIAGSTTANYYKSTDGGAIVGTAITNWTNTTVRIGGWYTT